MKKIFTGNNHSLFQLDISKNGLNQQMLPFKCEKIFGRTAQKKFDQYDIGGWDCDDGIFVFGKVEDVEKAFGELYQWMKDRTNQKLVEDDLADDEGLIYMGLFKSETQDIAVIIGGGYYQSTDEGLLNLLDTLQNVEYGEFGANHSDDRDFFNELVDTVEYQIENKKEVNPMSLAIISEVFDYWKKADIQIKEDRIEEGYEHVDTAVNKFKKQNKTK
jgi:hypothetical protein